MGQPAEQSKRDSYRYPFAAVLIAALVLSGLVFCGMGLSACRPMPAAGVTPPVVLRQGAAFSITESFDLGDGKARVYRIPLPQGGTVGVNLKIHSGPRVDAFAVSEKAYASYPATGSGEPFSLQMGTSYDRCFTLGPGIWYVGVWNRSDRRDWQDLVIDPATLAIDPVHGRLRVANDLAAEDPNERPVSVYWSIESWIGKRPGVWTPPIPFNYRWEVQQEGRRGQDFVVEPGLTPGRLRGSWSSAGKSVGVPGADDDTVNHFRLYAFGKLLLSQEHSASGTFDLAIQKPGSYDFVFDPPTQPRHSNRIVTLKGVYEPQ
jgi:hypothetical protein